MRLWAGEVVGWRSCGLASCGLVKLWVGELMYLGAIGPS